MPENVTSSQYFAIFHTDYDDDKRREYYLALSDRDKAIFERGWQAGYHYYKSRVKTVAGDVLDETFGERVARIRRRIDALMDLVASIKEEEDDRLA